MLKGKIGKLIETVAFLSHENRKKKNKTQTHQKTQTKKPPHLFFFFFCNDLSYF